jgi:hypothetical protein
MKMFYPTMWDNKNTYIYLYADCLFRFFGCLKTFEFHEGFCIIVNADFVFILHISNS